MIYVPNVKTTASELEAFKELSDDTKKMVTPLFELTRGRKHKRLYPDGDLDQAFRSVLDSNPFGEFILDLTMHEDLANSEIEALLDHNEGYKNWRDFISNTECADRIIPSLQVDGDHIEENPEDAYANILLQARELLILCPRVLLRVPIDIPVETFESLVFRIAEDIEGHRFILMIDVGYIKPKTAAAYANELSRLLELLRRDDFTSEVIVTSSSFPKIVTAPNYGEEHYGHFQLEEVALHKKMQSMYGESISLCYGDYGSIHPIRYDIRGGSWIPRVDVPLTESVYYYRYRRGEKEGGYKEAAERAVADEKFPMCIDCWGKKQIEVAANDTPAKLNPAFWISVRSNIHITTQVLRCSI